MEKKIFSNFSFLLFFVLISSNSSSFLPRKNSLYLQNSQISVKYDKSFIEEQNFKAITFERGTITKVLNDPISDIINFVNSSLSFWKAPGIAISIVTNKKVILQKGFGLRDVEVSNSSFLFKSF